MWSFAFSISFRTIMLLMNSYKLMSSSFATVWFLIVTQLVDSTGSVTFNRFTDADTLRWNRTLNFDNRPLVLKLADTDEPGHGIINQIFELLARERLGYKHIVHVPVDGLGVSSVIDQLRCGDESCQSLPQVYVDLLLWLPIGSNVGSWAPPSAVTDYGPLGPIRQWELILKSEFSQTQTKRHTSTSGLVGSCSRRSAEYIQQLSAFCDQNFNFHDNGSHQESKVGFVKVYEWRVNDTTVQSRSFGLPDPPVCGSSKSHIVSDSTGFCRTESYQAIKVSWAKLSTISPTLHQLVSRMYLSNDEYSELLENVSYVFCAHFCNNTYPRACVHCPLKDGLLHRNVTTNQYHESLISLRAFILIRLLCPQTRISVRLLYNHYISPLRFSTLPFCMESKSSSLRKTNALPQGLL
ncbi:hypothetical protein P879_10286 [Paragonimus westermani]|uniref:Uncharacterized protein n=2 Tax=Paragonimus westermani TaxID=34504 RepID=A0A8T0DG27_9TREM|nr:hypothetical protein P879_10286 [Paragonimus westermani]